MSFLCGRFTYSLWSLHPRHHRILLRHSRPPRRLLGGFPLSDGRWYQNNPAPVLVYSHLNRIPHQPTNWYSFLFWCILIWIGYRISQQTDTLYRHVHNICDFVKNNPVSVSKTTIKKSDTLRKGFDKEWEKKVIQFQVPIFSPTTRGSWILRFDDVLADALELGKLKNYDFSLSDGIKDYIERSVLTPSAQPAAELLVKYYIANKPNDTDKVVLPVTNIDAYFGNGNFSKKWLPKELDSVIIRDPQSNGVSRYTLHENLISLI